MGHASVAACQAAVSSEEFSEWIAFWVWEAELQEGAREDAPPSRDALTAKIHAWAAQHNAALAAKDQPRRAVAEKVK